MAIAHPFQCLFESFGRLPAAHADGVNRLAYQALRTALGVPLERRGRCILLRAPRAGCGKTHLLSRVQQHLGASHEFIPLHAAGGTRIDAATLTDDVLRRLTRPVPGSGALCELDLLVRRLFSLALQPLVRSGEVPCLDRDATLVSLWERPLETFDFHHPDALSAHWTRDNFGVLGPRLSLELAQLTGCSPGATGFWVEALFRFAAAPVEQPARMDALFKTALGGSCGEGTAIERAAALLALLALLTRVVLVADEVDGFVADAAAAPRLAAFLTTLRQSADRFDFILSTNRDVWENAFATHLSCAMTERLTELPVELEPLAAEDRVALLEAHAPGMGDRMLQVIGPDSLDHHARSLLQAAGTAWQKVARETSPATSPNPIASPPPILKPPTAPPVPPVAPPPVVLATVAPPPVVAQPVDLTKATPPPVEKHVEPPPLAAASSTPQPVEPTIVAPPSVISPPVEAHVEPPPVIVPAPITPPPVDLTKSAPPPVISAPVEAHVAPPPIVPASIEPPPVESTTVAPPPIISPPDGKPAVPPVREDSASRLSAEDPTGWKPVGQDSQDARPPAEPPPLPAMSPVRSALLEAFEKSLAEQAAKDAVKAAAPDEPAQATAAAPATQAAAPATQAAAPATQAAAPVSTGEPADAIDPDRVEALLRQFRERYGRHDPE